MNVVVGLTDLNSDIKRATEKKREKENRQLSNVSSMFCVITKFLNPKFKFQDKCYTLTGGALSFYTELVHPKFNSQDKCHTLFSNALSFYT